MNREIYLTLSDLNNRRAGFVFNILKHQTFKYLKVENMQLQGMFLNGLILNAERACFKNVCFQQISRDVVKSSCKFFMLKSCKNL